MRNRVYPLCRCWLFILTAVWVARIAVGQQPGVMAGPIANLATGHQYYLLEPAPWSEAEAAAVTLGGHLVTINDFDEDLWVRDTFANYNGVARDLWIGLHNPNPWSDPPDFVNWFHEFEWTSHQPFTQAVWGTSESNPTNTIRSGYCKMRGSATNAVWDLGTWVEEDGTTALSGVVELPLALEIIAQPQNVSARIGSSAVFNVFGDGTSVLDYQWQFSGTNLPGQTSSVLSLTNLSPSQSGSYSVLVHNQSGTIISTPAELLITNLFGWGANYDGELKIPAGLGTVRAVAAGLNFTLALAQDGKISGWGMNTFGQATPPLDLLGVRAMAAGRSHSLALRGDGTVIGWGDDSLGQTEPPAGLSNVIAIAAGGDHSLALRADGTVFCWGDGGNTAQPTLSNVVAIAAGSYHSLALLADGYVVAWPNTLSSVTPPETVVPTGLANVVAIAAGDGFSLALRSDGTIAVWGNNDWGQANLPWFLTNVVAIRAAGNHCLALRPDGTLIGWGSNDYYKNAIPSEVYDVVDFATGYDHNLAVTDTGAPRLEIEPWDRTFAPGANVVLCAKAAGNQPMQYQWRLGGADIPGATSDCYSITAAQTNDAGVYSLVVRNALGATTSRQANLVVNLHSPTNLAPILPEQPDLTIEQFTELVITNTASDPDHSSGFLAYALIEAPDGAGIDDQGIIHWTPGVLQAPSTNRITTKVTDSGAPPASSQNTFTVVVFPWTNRPAQVLAGPFVNPATGHQYLLLDRNSWTNAEANAVALGGHLATLNTPEENAWVYSMFGNFGGISHDLWIGLYDPDPLVRFFNQFQQRAKYAWSSGQPVLASFEMWAEGGPFDRFRTDWGYFKLCGPGNPTTADRGLWADEPVYTPLYSVVELPKDLEIIAPPQSMSVGVGCDATLAVYADGSSPLSYQWQWEGTNLPGQTMAKLVLTNIQFAQSGSYSVLVSNTSGPLMSQPAQVSVSAIVTWGSFLAMGDPRTNVPPGLTNVSAIAGGYWHDLALKGDGTVVAWGQNYANECDVPAGLSNVVGIAAGSGHSLALKNDGTVVAWGSQYGTTTQVPVGLTNVIAIDAGANNSLALKSDGTVVAWGEAYGGPSITPPGLTNVVAIAAGAGHDLALLADGTVIDWNDATGVLNATPVDLTNAVAISAGELTSLALRSDGTVVGWGTGLDMGGSLKIPADLTNAVGVSIKWDHSLAMAADGSMVAAWGTNFSGESSVPARLPNVIAIAGGYYHSIALLRDGAPNLTVQPWDRWVRAGASPALSAKAVSREPMSYQWQFNGTNIPGATTDTLRLATAEPTNSGEYHLTISNQVGVVVSRHTKLVVYTPPALPNHPPVLPNPANWAVYEETPLQILNAATDPDGTTNQLSYELLDPPAGATIDTGGLIRWTPGEEQGPGRFEIITVATKAGNPPLSATNTFFISVNELNSRPSLPLQTDRSICPLTDMSVTNTGSDADIPANTLSYQLLGAPAGASIDSQGVIRWTPARAQGPSTNWFFTVVTDNGQPNLSATNRFMVVVTAPVLMPIPNFTINPGQLLKITAQATDNDPSVKLKYTLDAAPNGATIAADTGEFGWRPPLNWASSSNFVQVRVTESGTTISDARSFVISVNPLEPTVLEPLALSNGVFRLRVIGAPGPDYVLEAWDGVARWIGVQTNTPTNLPIELSDTNAFRATNRFYRVRLGP